MKLILFIFFSLCLPILLFSQTEPLNQLDSAGKKHGKWIRYLDKDWKVVNDSDQAVYSRYTFYDHGLNVHPMGSFGGGGWTLSEPPDSNQSKGKIKLLNGEYKWYDEKGRLRFIHVLKNGEYVSFKEFYKSGTIQTFFDYTKKCEGQPHSWFVYIYDKKGNLKEMSPTCKNEKGKWPVMRG